MPRRTVEACSCSIKPINRARSWLPGNAFHPPAVIGSSCRVQLPFYCTRSKLGKRLMPPDASASDRIVRAAAGLLICGPVDRDAGSDAERRIDGLLRDKPAIAGGNVQDIA